jgi:hypothetical protein
MSTSHLWTRDNLHSIRKRGYQLSVSVWAGIVRGIVVVVQHDGAPAHHVEDVQQWLNATYPERWNGQMAWPPRSPDLNSDVSFPVAAPEGERLRGHTRTIEDLVTRLRAPVTTVDANMLVHVRENAVCLETNGDRFEHLLLTTRRPRSDHLTLTCSLS